MKKKNIWINGIIGGVASLITLSAAVASVPKNVTNDTALYQRMSEIKVSREKELNFDHDIAKLASAESNYRERLPAQSRLKAPMHRISQRPYRYSGRAASSKQ